MKVIGTTVKEKWAMVDGGESGWDEMNRSNHEMETVRIEGRLLKIMKEAVLEFPEISAVDIGGK